MTKVLLKVDDLRLDRLSGSWRRFFGFCIEESICVNVGVIGEWPRSRQGSATEREERAREMFRELAKGPRYSIWNHGFAHERDKSAGLSDFRGVPLGQQIRSIRMAQERIEGLSGVRMDAFGPPFNWWDQNTILALQQFPEITDVFYIPYVPGKTCFTSELFVECEPFKGKVRPGAPRAFSLDQAKQRSERFLELGRSFVLQIHPNSWDDDALASFSKFVSYLRKSDYAFVMRNDMEVTVRVQTSAPTVPPRHDYLYLGTGRD